MKHLENLIYKIRLKRIERQKKRFLFKRGYVKSQAEYEIYQSYYPCSKDGVDFVEFVMTHKIRYLDDPLRGWPYQIIEIEERPEMIQGFKDIRKRLSE